MKRHSITMMIGLFFAVCFTSPIAAQNVLTETFVSRDQAYKFDYAAGWQIEEQSNYILLTGQTDAVPNFGFFFFSPTLIRRSVGTNAAPDVLLNRLRPTFSFIIEDARLTTINGRQAAAAAADIGNDTIGFAFLIEMTDGGYGLALALAARDIVTQLPPLAVLVIDTYDTPTYADIVRANMPVTPVPNIQLENYAADSQRIIAELELLGIITPGSELSYQTEVLEVNGRGTGFNRPEPNRIWQDTLMMGELFFAPTVAAEAGLESCGMLARVAPDLRQYLEIGLDNTGKLYYFDTSGASLTDIFSDDIAQVTDFTEPVYIILIVRDERLTVFLNGIPLANNVRVQRRTGSFGIVMRAETATTECEIQNLRVYDLGGTCNVVADIALNLRAGPGLAFESVGVMANGESRLAVAYRYNNFEDFRWWQLGDKIWVREDVVTEVGACNTLPPSN